MAKDKKTLCPECGTKFEGNLCACGYAVNKNAKQFNSKPEDVLTRILSAWMAAAKPCPEEMPVAPRDAANWFIGIMQDRGAIETVAAYKSRLIFCLQRFLTESRQLQRLVIAARGDLIYWQGEKLERFVNVIDETEKMRTMGIDAYRNEAINKARGFLKQYRG